MSLANLISRRALLLAAGATLVDAALRPLGSFAATGPIEKQLVAAPGRIPLRGASQTGSDVWCYNGVVSGPEIRLRQGDRVRIVVENRLPQDTTVHWHGVRVPNPMDGALRHAAANPAGR